MLKVIGGVPDGEYKAIASGTLPNGKPVVVNSDGTVSVVGGSSVTEAIGSQVALTTASGSSENDYICGTFDSVNNKVIFFFRNISNSNYGTAVCGDISGTTITFGTPIVFRSASTLSLSAAFSPERERAVVAYTDSGAGSDGFAQIVYVDDPATNSLAAIGTRLEFNTNDSDANRIVYDGPDGSGGSYFLIHYRDDTSLAGKLALVNYPSGSHTLSLTNTTSVSGNTYFQDIAVGASYGSGVLSWRIQGNDTIYASVYSRSGTTVTLGSATQVNTDATTSPNISYNAASDKYVIAYYLANSPQSGKAVVGSVSGTSITFGTAVTFKSTATRYPKPFYHAASGNTIIAYKDNANGYGKLVIATISGTSISFGSEISLIDSNVSGQYIWPVPETENNTVAFGYKVSTVGYAKVYQPAYTTTNLTAENYIGMSKGVVSNTPSVVGSETIFEDAATRYTATAYDTLNNKIVIAYEDDANLDYGTAIVGTVSGNTISFGTPVVFKSANTDQQAIVFDENAGKVLITYRDNSDAKGYGIVGTVSGTSISFGTATQFESTNNPVSMNMSYDPDQQKCLLVWRANGALDVGRAKVATISGTSVSFGSLTEFFNGPIISPKVAYDTNENKHVVCFVDDQNTDRGLAIIGTVSGTSVTFGSTVVFDSTITSNNVITYDSSVQKVVIAYTDESNSNEGTAVVGTVSGNSISFGSPIVFTNPGNFQDSAITYDSGAEKIVISFRNADNSSKGTVISGKVAGNSITFDTEEIFNSGGITDFISSTYDPDQGKVVIAYQDSPNGDRGTCVVYQTGYTNRNPVADGANARLNIIGSVSDNQLSLTAGEKYYVQTDGTLSTTAGSPSVLAGTAISATKLVVKT